MSRVSKILTGIAKSNRVAGAYLFIGPPGAGKKAAAEEFGQDLKCVKQDLITIAPMPMSSGKPLLFPPSRLKLS